MNIKSLAERQVIKDFRFAQGIGLIKFIPLPDFLLDYEDTQCRACFDQNTLTAVKVEPNITMPCCEYCFVSKRIDAKIKFALRSVEGDYVILKYGNVVDINIERQRRMK